MLSVEKDVDRRVAHEVADVRARSLDPVEVLLLRGYDDTKVVIGWGERPHGQGEATAKRASAGRLSVNLARTA